MSGATLTLAAVIKGTVVDSAKHKPVSQAAIFIGRMPTGQRTGDDGTFHVSAPQGPLVVMIRRPGYVLAVEAFPHSGVTPPEFMGSPCAAIMLWMKEGGTALTRW